MKLIDTYRRKKLFFDGGMLTGTDSNGEQDEEKKKSEALSQGIQLAGTLGAGLIDGLSPKDPIGGQQSMGAHIGKGALSGAAMGAKVAGPLGAAVGGAVGLVGGIFGGAQAKREGDNIAHANARATLANEEAFSSAKLAGDPTLFKGNANSDYFAAGGSMGPGPRKPLTAISPAVARDNNLRLKYGITPASHAMSKKASDAAAEGMWNVAQALDPTGLTSVPELLRGDAKESLSVIPTLKGNGKFLKSVGRAGRAAGFLGRVYDGIDAAQAFSQSNQYDRLREMMENKTLGEQFTQHAFGGVLGEGEDPKKGAPTKAADSWKPRPVTPQLQSEWNAYLGTLGDLAGKPELDHRPTDGSLPIWKQKLQEFRKTNPGATLDESWIRDIQYDTALANENSKRLAAAKGMKAAQYGDMDVSKFDGWVGSRTSQQAYRGQVSRDIRNGEVVRQSNDGLVNSSLQATGTGGIAPAVTSVAKKQWKVNDVGVVQTPDGRFVAPDGTEIKAMGGNMRSVADFARSNTGAASVRTPLARMLMNGGTAKPLSADNTLMQGPSHAAGGIDIPGMGAEVEGGETTAGDFVFSKRLGFADKHLPLAKAVGTIEKKPPTQERLNSLKRLKIREQMLAQQQEQLKQVIGIQ